MSAAATMYKCEMVSSSEARRRMCITHKRCTAHAAWPASAFRHEFPATMNGKQRLYYTAPFCKQCFCLHRLIIVSRDTLKPCHAQSESSAPANEEGQESSGDESSIQLSMPRRSRMVTFTCNKCGERPIPHHYLALSSASKGKACRATGLHKHGLAV